MIKRREELGNVKHYDTSMALSELPCMNDISKVNSHISGGSLSDAF